VVQGKIPKKLRSRPLLPVCGELLIYNL